MKNIKSAYYIFSLLFITLFLFSACNRFDNPVSIFDPSRPIQALNPHMISIAPGDSAIAGVREITINGEYFSTIFDSNWVYIGGYKSIIKSVSANQIIVYRPPVYGDSLIVDVTVPAAFGTAKLSKKYKVERPLYPYDDRDIRVASQAYQLYAMDLDNSENLYIASSQVIHKVTPARLISTYFSTPISTFLTISDIKFGPGGYLYLTVLSSTAGESANIYRITPGSVLETFSRVPRGNANVMDFNQNGNLYTGFRNGIYIVHQDATVKSSGRYSTNYKLLKLRVYNGYIYVAAQYTGTDQSVPKMSIWRNRIVGTDSLDQNELVVNVRASADPALSHANTMISSFDIDANGNIYFCLQNSTKPLPYTIYVLENDGTISPFYVDKILPPVIDQIVWGTNTNVYLNRGFNMSAKPDSVRIYKMGMGVMGATYFGR